MEERYIDRRAKRLGGVAYQVADEIARAIELEIRVTVLGHVQRGGSPIPFDRILATRFGKAAADLIAKGDFGKMVALRGDEIIAVPIKDAVANPKYVDPNGQLVATAPTAATAANPPCTSPAPAGRTPGSPSGTAREPLCFPATIRPG